MPVNQPSFRAGLYGAQIFKMSNGYSYGQLSDADIADTTPAETLVSPALDVFHVATLGNASSPAIYANKFWGQQFQGKKFLGRGEIPDYLLGLAMDDPRVEYLVSGVAENATTMSGAYFGGQNLAPQTLNDIGIIVTEGADRTNPTTGAVESGFNHWFLMGTLDRNDNEIAGIQSSTTNPTVINYGVATQNFAALPNGELISSFSVGYTFTTRFCIWTPYKRMRLTTIVWDGTDTTFTLTELPLLNATATTSFNRYTAAGTLTALTSIDTSTGVVDPAGSAPAAGTVAHLFYPLANQN